jgi:general L-amino acid transport system substrate-binding protein
MARCAAWLGAEAAAVSRSEARKNEVLNFRIASIVLFALVCLLPGPLAWAGETLDAIRSRGVLRCGVSEGIPGFSFRDSSGRWRGMDVDFCRALAAATLGSPE